MARASSQNAESAPETKISLVSVLVSFGWPPDSEGATAKNSSETHKNMQMDHKQVSKVALPGLAGHAVQHRSPEQTELKPAHFQRTGQLSYRRPRACC